MCFISMHSVLKRHSEYTYFYVSKHYFIHICCLYLKSPKAFCALLPSWHSDVVTMLSQCRCWRCHNVVTRSKMRVVPTLVYDIVTTSLSDVIKTLPQRCCNVTTALSIGFLGHFTTDYSDFFPFIETWESYQSAKWY